jgi:hypothetical protein
MNGYMERHGKLLQRGPIFPTAFEVEEKKKRLVKEFKTITAQF